MIIACQNLQIASAAFSSALTVTGIASAVEGATWLKSGGGEYTGTVKASHVRVLKLEAAWTTATGDTNQRLAFSQIPVVNAVPSDSKHLRGTSFGNDPNGAAAASVDIKGLWILGDDRLYIQSSGTFTAASGFVVRGDFMAVVD